MVKNLIFLESATKKRTIQSFLGQEYLIFATSGHLWELKKSGLYNLGVDLQTFSPSYEIISEKKKLIEFWKKFLRKENIDLIYLATDPDREGEAIANEIIQLLKLKPSQYQRLLFYEITPRNIRQALTNPLSLNENLVEAQISRQVLDRMIGFCLSPLLQKKIQALSAGRVQSVVLKLIVERESAIKNYEKKKEYIIAVICQIKGKKVILKQVDSQGKLIVYSEKEQAEAVIKKIGSELQLIDQKEETKFILSKPPLTTSLLLSEAKSQLGFSIAQTTQLAQKLYEGIWLKKENKSIGLITYPRTDSTRINQDFLQHAYNYISQKLGKEHCNFHPSWEKKEKGKNVQDAHEAIHPTYLNYLPNDLKSSLTWEEFQLYELIFRHSLVSLMAPAKINKISYLFTSNNYYFATSERICQWLGFLSFAPQIYLVNYNVKLTSDLISVKQLTITKSEIQEYQENKPVRYNEGTLVQELERLGIGRPSTYNTFGSLLIKRKYVELDKKGHFIPCELGWQVNQWLQTNFPSLINEQYTALLEKELDQISQGQNNYLDFISNFWQKFLKQIKALE